tara:strand:+ start:483 stop:1067 length:585 start_codon:yes stop_codon:yes gene_type:complete
MKFKIIKYKKVTSTNDTAIKLIKKKGKISGYICSERQTKGRGTYGKKWISCKGNLFGSIFFPLNNNYPTFNEFSIINPVLISNVIRKFCKNKKINLKFPNDILINKKKICGILQEIITNKSKKFLIIGIGLNIIANPIVIKKFKATNIYAETQKKPKLNEIIKLITSSYENFFTNIDSYNYAQFKKKANLMSIK